MHFSTTYLCSNQVGALHISFFWVRPHVRGANEVLALNVDMVPSPTDMMHILQMNAVVNEPTFL